MLTVQEIARRLIPAGEVLDSNSNGYIIVCPGHPGLKVSGTIGPHPSDPLGEPVLDCWHGCKRPQIVKGLKSQKLWFWNKRKNQNEDLRSAFHDRGPSHGTNPYLYRDFDSDGNWYVVGRVVQQDWYDLNNNLVKVTYSAKRPMPDGSWANVGATYPWPIYNKEAVIEKAHKNGLVFCVDTESECDSLEEWYMDGFTHFGGIDKITNFAKARPDLSVSGAKSVLIIPHMDQDSMACALIKARYLFNCGIPVKIVALPNLTTGDTLPESNGLGLTDWKNRGYRREDLIKVAVDAAHWQPEPGDALVEESEEEQETVTIEAQEDTNVVSLDAAPGEDKNVFSENALSWAFKRMFGEICKYVPGVGWFIWNGKHWKRDTAGKVRELVAIVVERKKKEFIRIGLEPKEITHWYNRFGDLRPQNNVVTLSQSKCEASILEFDTDPMLLNCANCMIDLTTGDAIPHDKNKLCSKILPWEYKGIEYFEHARWTQFLDEVIVKKEPVITEVDGEEIRKWIPDRDTINAFGRAMGYSLTGLCTEKRAFLMLGVGDAGKSKIGERVLRLLHKGQYSKTASKRVFCVVQSENKYSDYVNVAFVRGVLFDEVGARDIIDDEKFKSITGGDELSCSYAHKDVFHVPATAKLWIYGNDKPKVHANGNAATWTRLLVFPFYRSFTETEQDKELDKKLDAEMSGILSWAVRGCLDWQARKSLQPSPMMATAKKEFQQEMDETEPFIAAFCEVAENYSVPATEFFEAFYHWQKHIQKMRYTWTQTKFGKEMADKGYKRAIKERKTVYLGIRLDPLKEWELRKYYGVKTDDTTKSTEFTYN